MEISRHLSGVEQRTGFRKAEPLELSSDTLSFDKYCVLLQRLPLLYHQLVRDVVLVNIADVLDRRLSYLL